MHEGVVVKKMKDILSEEKARELIDLFVKPELVEKINETIAENTENDLGNTLKFNCLESLPKEFSFSDENVAFDFDKLQFPLTLRNWQEGDAFQPFGMKGRKKVSDYLIDIKMPLPLKQNVRVLTSNGEIIWLVGLRTDERYKVSAKSKKIYLASLLK